MRILYLNIACVLMVGLSARWAFALTDPGAELGDVGISTKLGAQVDLNLKLTTSSGKTQSLAELLDSNRPTIVVPVYYHCPRLCGLTLKGLTTMLNALTLRLGQDFKVLTVSVDPEESVALAAERAAHYHNLYKNPEDARNGWLFAVGKALELTPLLAQLGFGARPDGGEFAHSPAIMILTPTGKISQYFAGIEFSPFDVRLALVEAGDGVVGSPMDHVFLFCFRFDETKGKYAWAVFNLMRAGGLMTLAGLVALIGGLLYRERIKARLV